MGRRPTQGDEKRLGSAATFYGTVALSFVIPTGAEGSAVSLNPKRRSADKGANPYWTKVSQVSLTNLSSRPQRSGVERPAVVFSAPQTRRRVGANFAFPTCTTCA
jgi:hypothetical protein